MKDDKQIEASKANGTSGLEGEEFKKPRIWLNEMWRNFWNLAKCNILEKMF